MVWRTTEQSTHFSPWANQSESSWHTKEKMDWPRVKNAWPLLLSSMIKWLDFWMRGEQHIFYLNFIKVLTLSPSMSNVTKLQHCGATGRQLDKQKKMFSNCTQDSDYWVSHWPGGGEGGVSHQVCKWHKTRGTYRYSYEKDCHSGDLDRLGQLERKNPLQQYGLGLAGKQLCLDEAGMSWQQRWPRVSWVFQCPENHGQ